MVVLLPVVGNPAEVRWPRMDSTVRAMIVPIRVWWSNTAAILVAIAHRSSKTLEPAVLELSRLLVLHKWLP